MNILNRAKALSALLSVAFFIGVPIIALAQSTGTDSSVNTSNTISITQGTGNSNAGTRVSADFSAQLQSISAELQALLKQVQTLVGAAVSGQLVDLTAVSSKFQSIKQEVQALASSMRTNASIPDTFSETRFPATTGISPVVSECLNLVNGLSVQFQNTELSQWRDIGDKVIQKCAAVANDAGADSSSIPAIGVANACLNIAVGLPARLQSNDISKWAQIATDIGEEARRQCGHLAGTSGGAGGAVPSTPAVIHGANLCAGFARDLSRGSRGVDVVNLQKILADNGLMDPDDTTGFFGPLTASALTKFQSQFDVTSSPTGTFGPLTRGFVQQLCEKVSHAIDAASPPFISNATLPGGGTVSSTTLPTWQGPTGTQLADKLQALQQKITSLVSTSTNLSGISDTALANQLENLQGRVKGLISTALDTAMPSGTQGTQIANQIQALHRQVQALAPSVTTHVGSTTSSSGTQASSQIKELKEQIQTLVSSGLNNASVPFSSTPPQKCLPRPACLDATPRCLPPEPAAGWCPATTITIPPQACTQDAKQCPDGSLVGRTGPHCEFVCSGSVTPTVPPTVTCPIITRTLSSGSNGNDVRQLQQFLAQEDDSFSSDNVTGFFGAATKAALGNWQVQRGLITDSAQGGVVGSRTREWLKSGCGGGTNGSSGNISTNPFFASPTSGRAPLTVRFSHVIGGGSANDYTFDFGDGTTGSPVIDCGNVPNGSEACPRALTASHTYAKAGTYVAQLIRKADTCTVNGQAVSCGSPDRIVDTVTITVSTITPPVLGGTGVTGMVLLGPTCPVVQNPPDSRCADKPFATSLAVTTADGSNVIKTFSSDANGAFKVALLPGTYAIASAGTQVLPHCGSNGTFTVSSGTFTTVAVSCDSGIR